MKNTFFGLLIGFLFFTLAISCIPEESGNEPLQNINSVVFGTQILDFKSAKLTITGPANITGIRSHVRATLLLSSAVEFQEPFAENTNTMTITLLSLNQGVELPRFPLASGTYRVFPPIGLPDPETIQTLNERSFCLGPEIALGYNPSLLNFRTIHESSSGNIQVTFDVSTSEVKINYDYIASDTIRVSGTSTLPLNLSSFTP